MKRSLLISVFVVACFSFTKLVRLPVEKPVFIEPSVQRTGDEKDGYKYLTTGAFVRGGIPYDIYQLGSGKNKAIYLNRDGLNADVTHDYTVVKATNGENLVSPNCMQCHAQVFDSTLVIGLGNSMMDFSTPKLNPQAIMILETMLKSNSPSKYEASKHFLEVTKTIAPFLTTQVRGVNAADRLTGVLVAHRDPQTFKWLEKPSMDISKEVIPTDVPAWWMLKKKNAMFYNGFGRGDFGKFLMASNLLTVRDTAEAREVDSHMNDVLSYIRSLEPPKYPRPVNEDLAENGHALYITSCAKCHGKYGNDEEYPNLLIPESIIKTDSLLLRSNFQQVQIVSWFNNSWFSKGDHPARLEPYNGYIAPPLDGVWVTAPYLHNGSVPTIEGVLNSKSRPAYWERSFTNPQYDYEKLGWKFETRDQPGGNTVYNTTLPGYGNYGHDFGDKLTASERNAVIEYLKTL